MIENIRKLGYELTDIKKILLSHAHIDHIGACRTMKELTGAKVYLGERDLMFLHERKDLIMNDGGYTAVSSSQMNCMMIISPLFREM